MDRSGTSRIGLMLSMVLVSMLLVGATDPSPHASASPGSLVARTAPVGSTEPIDEDTWALVDRLTAPSYTTDTTAAMVEGLARSGVATFADPSSQQPEVALGALPSPFRLLDFQTHALAVGAWAGSTFSGAELDTVMPLPPGLTDIPTTSELLAAYVATADSPGGALARGLMAGQDLLDPPTLRFPGIVLVLFVSDLATDGGRLSALGVPAAAVQPLLAVAVSNDRAASDVTTQAISGGFCSETATWVKGAIAGLFEALKVATPSSAGLRVVAGIWNWLVDAAHAFVESLVSSVTDYVMASIRSIADSVAAVAEQVASLVPYGVRVVAASESGGGATFKLGPEPLAGHFTATVTAGDLPAWPAVLVDCAETAKVKLPDFHSKRVPLTWGPLEASGPPLLAAAGSAHTNDITDDGGQATWAFATSSDPGDPDGEQQNQFDYMPVTVFRPEIAEARQRLTGALLGPIPGLLRPYVAAIFAPYLDGIQARLNAILDARGRGTALLVYHAPAKPTPTPAITPTPSAACADPMPTGSYSGTNSSTETIKNRPSVTRTKTKGPVSLVVAGDGSVTGTWSWTAHFVYDADVVGVKHHHESTQEMTGGTVSGTACDLVFLSGTSRFTRCVDSLSGDCLGTANRPSRPAREQHLGPPTSSTAGTFIWRTRYDVPADGLTSSSTISLTGP